jgi:hypothetical protein
MSAARPAPNARSVPVGLRRPQSERRWLASLAQPYLPSWARLPPPACRPAASSGLLLESTAADLRKDVLKSADGILRLRVLLGTWKDSAEGAATISGQGTPVQDRFERVESTGEKPGEAAVSTREGDRQDGERFSQAFEPLDLR